MVKADAYGLGAVGVARALEPLDPWGYGVATIDEGEELRAAGITRPVLVFTPLLPRDFAAARAAALRADARRSRRDRRVGAERRPVAPRHRHRHEPRRRAVARDREPARAAGRASAGRRVHALSLRLNGPTRRSPCRSSASRRVGDAARAARRCCTPEPSAAIVRAGAVAVGPRASRHLPLRRGSRGGDSIPSRWSRSARASSSCARFATATP